MRKFPAILVILLILTAGDSFSQTTPMSFQPTRPGAAGTPGDLDKNFKSFLGGPNNVRFLGTPNLMSAAVYAAGEGKKVLIGGSFRLAASNVSYSVQDGTRAVTVNVVWRNLIRLNGDGTLDTSFISETALANSLTGGTNIEFGPDGAVYSILVEPVGDLYRLMVAGDFLNFIQTQPRLSLPRKRYLMLQTLLPSPVLETAPGEVKIPVKNAEGRLQLRDPEDPTRSARVGTLVLQLDNGKVYRKTSQGPDGAVLPGVPPMDTWVVVPEPSEPLISLVPNLDAGDGFNDPVNALRRFPISGSNLYFAAGNFTSFANAEVRGITQLAISTTGGISQSPSFNPPQPEGRVFDIAALGQRIFFVGDFKTLKNNASANASAQLQWSGIAAMSSNGTVDLGFQPGSGFDGPVRSIVADAVNNRIIVVGKFTNYNDLPVGRIVRLNPSGVADADFPAPNNKNDSGANGPILSVLRQSDGRLLIAGEFTAYNGIDRAGIARLEPDGSLDETFVPQGKASGIQTFAYDQDGGPSTSSLIGGPIAVGNFQNLFASNLTGVARFISGRFPVIWYQPNKINQPHAVTLGDSKVLRVIATDNWIGYTGELDPPLDPLQRPYDTLEYQWQRNGKNIQGATQPELELKDFSASQAGRYSVRIYNSQFLVVSEPVSLEAVNPFSAVLPPKGLSVNGRIAPNPTLNGGLGGSIQFTMSRTGMVSGTIVLGNPGGRLITQRFSGQYNYTNGLEIQIRRPNQSPLTLRLQADVPGVGTELPASERFFEFAGDGNSISDSFGNTAALIASNIPWSKSYPATPYASSLPYNIGLTNSPAGDPDELIGEPGMEQPRVPQGYGFISMRILPANGQARLSGVLSDGTRFSATTAVLNDASGTVPIWIPLYSAQGSLTGTLSISSDADENGILPDDAVNPVLAELVWNKPSNVPKSPGAAGFTGLGLSDLPGSGLFRPAIAAQAPFVELEIADGAWEGLPGSLTGGPIFQAFTVANGRGKADGDNPAAVTFGFAPRTGLMRGNFVNADVNDGLRRVAYQGIALTGTGLPEFFGFFVMPNLAKFPAFYVGGSVSGSGN